MKQVQIVAVGVACVATACVPVADRAKYKPGAFVKESEAIRAFSDAVVGHCIPAIESDQAFKDFEIKGVTPIRALEERRISMFDDTSLPVWQMADAVVQMQLEPGRSCEVVAVSLPADISFKVIASRAKKTEYGYRDKPGTTSDTNGPRHRLLVSGAGESGVTLDLTGPVTSTGEAGKPYTKLIARVTKGVE